VHSSLVETTRIADIDDDDKMSCVSGERSETSQVCQRDWLTSAGECLDSLWNVSFAVSTL
jgi:hypothetical protein